MRRDTGFTLVELMTVVLIIGVLVAIGVPVFASASGKAEERNCMYNQRVLEGAATAWITDSVDRSLPQLAGLVGAAHPVVADNFIRRAPSCASAPPPVDKNNPTAAEGGYTFNDAGIIGACGFGKVAHGHYSTQ